MNSYLFKRWWGKHVSGPIIGIVAILMPFVARFCSQATAKELLDAGGIISAVICAFLIIVAQYEVWKEKRDALIVACAALDAEADMQGTIFIYPQDSMGRPDGKLGFTIDCANHGRKPCEISKIVFVIQRGTGEQDKRVFPLYSPAVHTVGHGEQFRLEGGLFFSGIEARELHQANIQACLMDSLANEYWRNTKTVAKVPFSYDGDGL